MSSHPFELSQTDRKRLSEILERVSTAGKLATERDEASDILVKREAALNTTLSEVEANFGKLEDLLRRNQENIRTIRDLKSKRDASVDVLIAEIKDKYK